MRILLTLAAWAWMLSALIGVQPITAYYLARILFGATIVIWMFVLVRYSVLAVEKGF